MCKRSDGDWLGDIEEAIRRVLTYTVELGFEGFLGDTKVQDAVVRNLEVIGEATKNLSESLRKRNPELPWRELAGVRDKMIHHYFGVNYETVWTIVTEDLPLLLPQITQLLTDTRPDDSCAASAP